MNKVVGRFILFGVPVLILVLFFVLFAAMMATAPRPEQAEFTPRPAAVFVAEARSEPVRLTVVTQGEVRPLIEISLTSQVSGRIAEVNPSFTQGGFFEAGETLVRIDDADYRLAATRAEAQVAQARQRLLLEEAEGELAREEWSSIGQGEASALALREPQLAEARAQLAAAEASLQEARLNLERTRISAPFAGRVREKSADLGQYVGAGSQLGAVFSTGTAQIRLPMTDAQLGKLGIPVAFRATADEPGPEVAISAVVAGQPRRRGRPVRGRQRAGTVAGPRLRAAPERPARRGSDHGRGPGRAAVHTHRAGDRLRRQPRDRGVRHRGRRVGGHIAAARRGGRHGRDPAGRGRRGPDRGASRCARRRRR
jgi:multidrug efflux pump subunit AcrA (membrane-fusion protein)